MNPNATLTLLSPAKLNLFLHINGRRADGYHELQTAFQLLDFGDEMRFELRNESDGTRLTSDIQGVADDDNLVIKATALLREQSGCKHGADIQLTKRIPMGGGLGGGSSNAATTLLALNHLWELKFSIDQLAELGARLGADVPVFVRGHSAWAEGVGEQIQELELPQFWYVVISPDCHVSTAQIFSHQRLTRDTPKIKIAPALEGRVLDKLHNDCEALASQLNPEIKEAISWLKQFGPGRMTGTGACCFCRFDSEAEARQVLNEARSKFKGFVAKGVNLSPAHQRLNEAESFATNHS